MCQHLKCPTGSLPHTVFQDVDVSLISLTSGEEMLMLFCYVTILPTYSYDGESNCHETKTFSLRFR